MCSRAAGLALILLAAPAAAQDDAGELPASLTSDRPGFAFTPAVAARGRLTMEAGVSVEIADAPVGRAPHLSLRTGLFDWLEARLRGPNAVGIFTSPDPSFGTDDPLVGLKVGGQLADTLALAAVWEVALPLATTGFGAPEAQWYAHAQLEWQFFGPLAVTVHGYASVLASTGPTGETVRTFEGAGSLKGSFQLLEVLGLYVQSYVIASEQRALRVGIGGGVAWLVARNVQVDASFDGEVTQGSNAPVVGVGTTVLW